MVTFRAPINQLRFKDPIPAGMNPYTLLGLVPLLRGSAEDPPPITVSPPDSNGTRTVLDGRHRWIAAVMAGRHDVLAVEEETP